MRVCSSTPYSMCQRTPQTALYDVTRVMRDSKQSVSIPLFHLTLSASGDIKHECSYLLYVWGGTLTGPPHLQLHTHSPDPDPVKHVLNPHDRAPAAQRRCRNYSHATRLRPDAVRPRLHYPLAQLALMHQTQ